jgi:hypothetical protein
MAEGNRRQQAQLAADCYEQLELHKWKLAFPAHVRLRKIIEEAARRAESLARLEDALLHLTGARRGGAAGGEDGEPAEPA